jgi:hypothetical protein
MALSFFNIEDTGIGIDAEMCNVIFERFRQGEESITRSYGGTGLGLSISKGIIELLGGMIWVDLSYAPGSRFCFTIPAENNTEHIPISTFKKSHKELEKRCIILTDQKDPYRGFMTQLLTCYSINIPIVHLNEFENVELDFEPELIIYDVHQSENTLLQHIKKTAQVFVNSEILTVADKTDDVVEKYRASGCTVVLSTPVNYQVLQLFIHKLFSKKQPE